MAELTLRSMSRLRIKGMVKDRLAWSSCRPPRDLFNDYAENHKAAWQSWTSCLVQQVTDLQSTAPAEAFKRLVEIYQVIKQVFAPIFSIGNSPLPLEIEFRGYFPQFLHALVNGGPADVVDRLFQALSNEGLDIAELPAGLFNPLSYADRTELLDRLCVYEKARTCSETIRVALTEIMLSEPDPDRFVAALEGFQATESISAVAMVERLIADQRLSNHFAAWCVQAVLGDGAKRHRARLLDQSLALCGASSANTVAQEIRLSLFRQTLAIPFAKDWLRNLPARQRFEMEETVILQHLLDDPRRGRSLSVLLAWPDFDKALDLARNFHQDTGDLGWQDLCRASELFESKAPDVALKLYRVATKNMLHEGISLPDFEYHKTQPHSLISNGASVEHQELELSLS
jgi:hypothetical protein